MDQEQELAVFGGGCFWCTEAVFAELKGVSSVVPGYAGGGLSDTSPPTYELVSGGQTNYAEVIAVYYDPTVITYETLLAVFFATHDPYSLNRQGNDVGPQYRSVIFYNNLSQKKTAEDSIAELNKKRSGIVTEIVELDHFFPAEDYHQKYYQNHKQAPYCQLVIDPKLDKLRKNYSQYLKSN